MADRELPPVRDAMAARGNDQTALTVPDRAPVGQGRDMTGRGIVLDGGPIAQGDVSFAQEPLNTHVDTSSNPALDTTNQSHSPSPLYGTDSPFAILGDLFNRDFGMQGDNTPQTQFVPIAGGSTGSGGTMGIVLLMLLALGAAYYFFVYKKGAA